MNRHVLLVPVVFVISCAVTAAPQKDRPPAPSQSAAPAFAESQLGSSQVDFAVRNPDAEEWTVRRNSPAGGDEVVPLEIEHRSGVIIRITVKHASAGTIEEIADSAQDGETRRSRAVTVNPKGANRQRSFDTAGEGMIGRVVVLRRPRGGAYLIVRGEWPIGGDAAFRREFDGVVDSLTMD